jgi:hypothetical protein
MTAVLVIGFNRPDAVETTCSTLVDIGLTEIYLAVDGPRGHIPQDQALVTRSINVAREVLGSHLKAVLAQETNLGCATAVPTAIDWFFSQVDEGLILEDDCVPSVAVPEYVAVMLRSYQSDPSVSLISCGSFAPPAGAPPVYLSRFPQLWGWATWADSWRDLRPSEGQLTLAKKSTTWRRMGLLERRDWVRMFRLASGPRPSTWDYAILASMWATGTTAVVPRVPLVRNIGFGLGATHADHVPSWYWESSEQELEALAAALRHSLEPLVTYDPGSDLPIRRHIYSPPISERIRRRLRLLRASVGK